MNADSTPPVVGIIGGSGLYDIDGLEKPEWRTVETAFGRPSDALLCGELEGCRVVFLPRHGRGHRIPPNDLNFRANIDALKRLGVTEVIAMSAVGSLREALAPGTFVLVDQYIDRTVHRVRSFFEAGFVAHVSMADPVCRRLGDTLAAAGAEVGVELVRGGTYLVMEGPQFSSRAESNVYRSWGCDVIGMTNMPEAKLAREAELCYATVAMVTDYDCWHDSHDAVSVDQVVAVLNQDAARARALIKSVVPRLRDRRGLCPAGCHRALEGAVITAPDAVDPAVAARLEAVAGRILRSP
jgi:5'-methylthioadenosine phosphorylase